MPRSNSSLASPILPMPTLAISSLAVRFRTATVCLACAAVLAACGSTPSSADDVASFGTPGTDASTGETSPDTSTPDSVDPQEAFLEYTECMRDEGIDMPDPQAATAGSGPDMVINTFDVIETDGGGGAVGAPGLNAGDIDSEEYAAANEVCGSILDDAFGDIEIDPELEAEQREQMLAFAQCMRDQGIDFPDPVFSSNGGATMTVIDDGEGGDRPSEEEMQAAHEACADEMPDGAFAIGSKAGD